MTPYQKRLNGYILRMAEDMQVRNMADATIDAYTYHVDKFCKYFGKAAEQLGPEEIREYQLFLVNEKKVSWSSFNQAVCGLRFVYEVTLHRPWEVKHIPFGKRPKKLPVVLSNEEASRLLSCDCLPNPKHRAVLLTCYAAGLRLTESTHLRVADIERRPAAAAHPHGEGSKERFVPASPRLLNELRAYWKLDRPSNYLFPGKSCDTPCHDDHSEGDEGGRREGRNSQGGNAAHDAAFLGDRHAGSGRGSADDQQAVGPFKLRHDDGLSARPSPALRPLAEPDRLAAGAAVSQVGGARVAEPALAKQQQQQQQQQQRPRVIDLLRKYTPSFLSRRPVAWQVKNVLSRVLLCRTSPLKGHVYECPDCTSRVPVYNSCVDRHCPQCGGARRSDWLAKTRELIVPSVNYFQVVFTVPDKLSGLMLGNRRELYTLLFHSAWRSLQEVLCGSAPNNITPNDSEPFQPAAQMVLHT